MAISSVTSASSLASLFGVSSTRVSSDAAVAKLDSDAAERQQLETLSRRLQELTDALAAIHENWRRSDQEIPGGAAAVASGAVLDQAGDANTALGSLEAFAGVSAGTLTINGVEIAFDPSTDSLQDLVDRIDGAGAGVGAALDDSGLGLVITSDDPSATLAIADGGTGLLSALGIDPGSHGPTRSGHTPGMSWDRARTIAEAMTDAVTAINAIFSDEGLGTDESAVLKRARSDLKGAVEGAWEADTSGMMSNIDFRQDFEVESGDVMSFTRRTGKLMVGNMRERPATVETMLFGTEAETKDGLIGRLEQKAMQIRQRLDITFARRGITVDTHA
ncbi:MAG TPA: flagellin hook IN motif-containing protein [Candidatus Krumholzibacteria bacterium]|nr:flagellin hook IN motif-containing protein [Candidatus Krumholzibacteria bacterium]